MEQLIAENAPFSFWYVLFENFFKSFKAVYGVDWGVDILRNINNDYPKKLNYYLQ